MIIDIGEYKCYLSVNPFRLGFMMKKQNLKIERKRLGDQIIERIMQMIGNGELKTGDMLPSETELMKQFGVGRSSLREAIGALSLMGVLDVHPGRGTRVIASSDTFLRKPLEWSATVRNDTIEELIEARIVIEEAVAGVSALKATDKDIMELETITERIDEVKKNKKKTPQLDVQFHLAIANASHNSVLIRTVLELRHLMRTWMDQNATYVSNEDMEQLMIQHKEIIKAIRNRDVDRARCAARNHIAASSKNLRLTLLDRQLKARVYSV